MSQSSEIHLPRRKGTDETQRRLRRLAKRPLLGAEHLPGSFCLHEGRGVGTHIAGSISRGHRSHKTQQSGVIWRFFPPHW
jgi:hypothetical protein